MFFKQRNDILFRSYDSFGYITDNRNFSYIKNYGTDKYIGDKILSESGSVFFSVLEKIPQSVDILASLVCEIYSDVDINIIKKDLIEFYLMLEDEGFVVSGDTIKECHGREKKVIHDNTLEDTHLRKSSSMKLNQVKSTQDFLFEHFKGIPQLSSVHIEITSKCNERCVHCYIPHEAKIKSISPDLFMSVLEQCKEMKVLHLTLSGGEPMLHKHFCEFLKKCRELEFSVSLLTNLTLINDEILEEMKRNPLLGVQTSLYSMTPEIHDNITKKKGSFVKTKKAILELVKNKIPLQLSCPIMQQNKNSYQDVISWASEYQIPVGDDYVIIAKHDHSTDNLVCRMTLPEVKDVIRKRSIFNKKFFSNMEYQVINKRKESSQDFICSVCSSSVCISETGNVYPCAGWQSQVIGNVKDTLLSDIWNYSEEIKYLRELRKSDFPKCVQCSDKDYCTMCMVRNANENPNGDPLVVNEYFCEIAKFNKELMNEWKDNSCD